MIRLNKKQNHTGKTGFTIIEVMVAAMILSIATAAVSTYLINAARKRMDYRQKSAALIEANSMLEEIFGRVSSNTFSTLTQGYLDANMTLTSANPGLVWPFDGNSFAKSLNATNNGDFADITVSVAYGANNNTVQLSAKRCLK